MERLTFNSLFDDGFVHSITIFGVSKMIIVKTAEMKRLTLKYFKCVKASRMDGSIVYEFFRNSDSSRIIIKILTTTDGVNKIHVKLPYTVKTRFKWCNNVFTFDCGSQVNTIVSELDKRVVDEISFDVTDITETKCEEIEVKNAKENRDWTELDVKRTVEKLKTDSGKRFLGFKPVNLNTRYLETNGFEVELKYSPTESKIVDVVELKTDHDELNDYYDYKIRTVDDYVIDVVFDKQDSRISFHNIPGIGHKKIIVSRDDFKMFERVAYWTHRNFMERYKKKEMELSGIHFNISSRIRREKNEKKFVVAISFLPGLFLFGEITNFSKYLDERTDTLNIGIRYRNLNDVFLRVYLKEKKVIVRGANKVANAVFYFDTNGFSVLKSRINSVEASFRKYKINLMK